MIQDARKGADAAPHSGEKAAETAPVTAKATAKATNADENKKNKFKWF
jgi:hypothetical protein